MSEDISHLVAAELPCEDATPAEREHTRMYWSGRNGDPTGRTGTCQICSKKRKLYRFNSYYERCSECLTLGPEAAKEKAKTEGTQTRKLRNEKARKAYPCIGGPLDGEHATTDDMVAHVVARRDYGDIRKGDVIREGGLYGHIASQYQMFNSAVGDRGPRIGGAPTMVFIHESKLLPLKAPRDR